METTIDEKGRITIPQEIRNKLDLQPGSKIIFSVIENILLLRRAISPEEFDNISDQISNALKDQIKSPIEIEKLF